MTLTSLRAVAGMIIACTAVVIGSARLRWVSASAGGEGVSYALTDLPLALAAMAPMLLAVLAGAVAALAGRARGLELAGVAGLALVLVVGALICFAEGIASLLPQDLLPTTARRAAFGSGACVGAWVAFVGALAIVVIAAAATSPRVAAVGSALWARGASTCVVLAGLALAVAALVHLRQTSWIDVIVGSRRLALDGLVVPVVSPVTFAAVWLLAGAVLAACLGAWELGALGVATAGWLVNAGAGLAIGGARLLAALHLPHVDAARATGSAWLAFAGGLLVAAAATILLRQGDAR